MKPTSINAIIEDALDSALGSMIDKLDPANELGIGDEFGYARDVMGDIRHSLTQALVIAIKTTEAGLLDKLKRVDANGWAIATDGSLDAMCGIERIMTIDDAIYEATKQ
jgi:hypothetical protein